MSRATSLKPLLVLICLACLAMLGGALLLQGRNTPIARQGPLFATVLAGFAGVAMVLRPSLAPDQVLGAIVGLASGVTSATLRSTALISPA